MIDQMLDKIAGLGVAGIVFAVVMATSGLTGVYAITATLSTLGGPLGMLGGIAALGVISMISTLLAKFGIDKLVVMLVQRMAKNGMSKQKLLSDLSKKPWTFVLSTSLRLQVMEKIKNS